MSARYLLISIGNTRTRMGMGDDATDRLEPSRVVENSDAAGVARAIGDYARLHHAGGEAGREGGLRALVATVNAPLAERVCGLLGAQSPGLTVVRFGAELPIPISNTLEDERTVGQDRLLDALGAYWRSRQACVVIDAGTAVTVDFVDGEGVFHGGAIAPGVSMMLRALHDQTTALPSIGLDPALIPAGAGAGEHGTMEAGGGGRAPFGKTTAGAMTLGVVSAVRGLVHLLVDRYAEYYGGYPRVVATGGDAPMLFEGDAIVEAVVPDLTLVGMLAAVQVLKERAERGEDDEAQRDGEGP